MGVRATITEISPQAFMEFVGDGNPDISKFKSWFLDKAWSEIHDMFQREGYPLSLAIVGRRAFRAASSGGNAMMIVIA